MSSLGRLSKPGSSFLPWLLPSSGSMFLRELLPLLPSLAERDLRVVRSNTPSSPQTSFDCGAFHNNGKQIIDCKKDQEGWDGWEPGEVAGTRAEVQAEVKPHRVW